jgi:hypothetical protein
MAPGRMDQNFIARDLFKVKMHEKDKAFDRSWLYFIIVS